MAKRKRSSVFHSPSLRGTDKNINKDVPPQKRARVTPKQHDNNNNVDEYVASYSESPMKRSHFNHRNDNYGHKDNHSKNKNHLTKSWTLTPSRQNDNIMSIGESNSKMKTKTKSRRTSSKVIKNGNNNNEQKNKTKVRRSQRLSKREKRNLSKVSTEIEFGTKSYLLESRSHSDDDNDNDDNSNSNENEDNKDDSTPITSSMSSSSTEEEQDFDIFQTPKVDSDKLRKTRKSENMGIRLPIGSKSNDHKIIARRNHNNSSNNNNNNMNNSNNIESWMNRNRIVQKSPNKKKLVFALNHPPPLIENDNRISNVGMFGMIENVLSPMHDNNNNNHKNDNKNDNSFNSKNTNNEKDGNIVENHNNTNNNITATTNNNNNNNRRRLTGLVRSSSAVSSNASSILTQKQQQQQYGERGRRRRRNNNNDAVNDANLQNIKIGSLWLILMTFAFCFLIIYAKPLWNHDNHLQSSLNVHHFDSNVNDINIVNDENRQILSQTHHISFQNAANNSGINGSNNDSVSCNDNNNDMSNSNWIEEKRQFEFEIEQLESKITKLMQECSNIQAKLGKSEKDLRDCKASIPGERKVEQRICEQEKQQCRANYNECKEKLESKSQHFQLCNKQLNECRKETEQCFLRDTNLDSQNSNQNSAAAGVSSPNFVQG